MGQSFLQQNSENKLLSVLAISKLLGKLE